jgi:hypothetical protein
MSVTRILDGLEGMPVAGKEADSAARQGFLEWVFASPEEATPQAAREALSCEAAQDAQSPAARAFVRLLQAASVSTRGGYGRAKRRRVLH